MGAGVLSALDPLGLGSEASRALAQVRDASDAPNGSIAASAWPRRHQLPAPARSGGRHPPPSPRPPLPLCCPLAILTAARPGFQRLY